VLNVKKYVLSSAIAAAIFGLCFAWGCFTSSPASAQQPGGIQSPLPGVAIVDVNYIFKKHGRLKAQLAELKADGDRVQKDFEEQMRQLAEQAKPLTSGMLKSGSVEANQLEEKIVQQRSIIRGNIELKRKDFMQREAHLYNNAYKEICDEVRMFSEQNRIALVLNFNGDAIHEEDPQDVARGIGAKTVYYNKQLDITPYILPRFVERTNTANTNNFNPNPSPQGLH
jgi:Skp family chaperone for outer membrane proteins